MPRLVATADRLKKPTDAANSRQGLFSRGSRLRRHVPGARFKADDRMTRARSCPRPQGTPFPPATSGQISSNAEAICNHSGQLVGFSRKVRSPEAMIAISRTVGSGNWSTTKASNQFTQKPANSKAAPPTCRTCDRKAASPLALARRACASLLSPGPGRLPRSAGLAGGWWCGQHPRASESTERIRRRFRHPANRLPGPTRPSRGPPRPEARPVCTR